jgi:hypothetical protein
LLTGRARGRRGGGSLGLPGEGSFEQMFSQAALQGGGGPFQIGQGRAQGGAAGTVEAIDQRFGHTLKVKANISERIRIGSCARHPWRSQAVVARSVSH